MLILIVDDDPLAGEMCAAVMQEAGHETLLAEDAMSAMTLLNENPAIALIISDMNMPLVSGVELFNELREQGVHLPFILLTGDDPAKVRDQAPLLSGCVMKDFNLDETLPAIVAQVMGSSS